MSLRARTTILVAVVTAALLVGGAVALDAGAAAPADRARPTTSPARGSPTCWPWPSRVDLPDTLVNVTDDAVAQVVDDEGRVVAASPNATGAAPLTDEPTTGGLHVADVVGPDDDETEEYRLWTSTGPAADGGRVRVYVGTSLESVREATASLRRACGSAYPRLAAPGRGVVAAGRTGAAPPRPDPRRGRHHHRGRPLAAGGRVRAGPTRSAVWRAR